MCYRSSIKRFTGNGIPKGLVRCVTSNLGNFLVTTLRKLLSTLHLPKVQVKVSENILIIRSKVGAQLLLNLFTLGKKDMLCLNFIILAFW